MSDLSLVLLSSLCVLLVLILLLLILVLVRLLTKANSTTSTILVQLLNMQTRENQSLRNQLRSPDLPTLNGLNYATGTAASSSPSVTEIPDDDLGDSINYELNLAANGYSLGGLSDDLESAGWPRVVTKDGSGSDPVAFDVS